MKELIPRKNWPRNKTNITIFLLLLQLISCKPDYPKTEGECLKEAKTILDFVRKSDYGNLLKILKKYEAYSDYDLTKSEKVYKKLHDYLQDKSMQKIKYTIQRDTLSIESVEGSQSAFFEINFLKDTILDAEEELSFCEFSYVLHPNINHYSLSLFMDNFHQKLSLPAHAIPPEPR